jgi:spore coat protein CotF
MEKVLTEQALARMAIIHCKISSSQLVLLATETSNSALRDQVQKALEANLKQQKKLWDAAYHAGFLPNLELSLHTLNQADLIAPSLKANYEQEDL